MASMTACPRCYETSVVSSSEGKRCMRCPWSERNPNLTKRRRHRSTAPRVTHPSRAGRAAPKRPWQPLTAPEPVAEAALREPQDERDTELTLSPTAPVERARVAKLKARIVEVLTAQGAMTRDGLGAALLPELSPGECRRYIFPRVDELVREGRVRVTARKGLTRRDGLASMVEVVS